MKLIKGDYDPAITKLPANTSSYIYHVLTNDHNYPNNTIIRIDPQGGLSVTVPHHITVNRYDINLPTKQKITCTVCDCSLGNDSYGLHIKSLKHKRNLTQCRLT